MSDVSRGKEHSSSRERETGKEGWNESERNCEISDCVTVAMYLVYF